MKIPITNDCPELESVETPAMPERDQWILQLKPQSQVDYAYVQFLEARKASLERAIGEALYYLDQGCGNAKGRAWEVLKQAMTS